MAGIVNISDKFTGYVLLRYFAQEDVEGLCSLYISPKTKEQIELGHTFHTIADGHINKLNAIKCFFDETKPTVFFFPKIELNYFFDDQTLVKEYEAGKNFWHIKPIKNIIYTPTMYCEVLFVECKKDCFSFVAHTYPNPIITGIINTAGVKYEELNKY